jgi:HEAT repeat protein
MKQRRYAIGALGYIGDRAALPTLEVILRTEDERDYFRGDALRSIYQIDPELGSKYAVQFEKESDYLRMVATAIGKRESWLVEPSKE